MMLDREKILEVLAFWRTRVSAGYLGKILGVSRQTAQDSIIKGFRDKFPGHLEYQRRENGLPDGVTLEESVISEQDIGRVFGLLSALSEFGRSGSRSNPMGRASILGFPAEEVKMPETGNQDILRKITSAAGHNRALVGLYSFKNKGDTRVRFSPHSMVKTPFRIHFRGYLESWSSEDGWVHHGYRDLVPSRFIDIEEVTTEGVRGTGDKDWNEEEVFTFRLNPDLPASVRSAFAREQGLNLTSEGHYETSVPSRRCYGHYYRMEVFSRTWGEGGIPIWIEI